MKKISKLVLIFSMLEISNAAPIGTFVGFDAGYSVIDTDKHNIFNANKNPASGDDSIAVEKNIHSIGGLGESIVFGRNFTERFGLTLRMDNYAESKYELKECSVYEGKCHYTADGKLSINEQSLKVIGNFYQTLFGKTQLRADVGLAMSVQEIKYFSGSDNENFYVENSAQKNVQEDKQTIAVAPVLGIGIERVFHNQYSVGFTYQRVFNRFSHKTDAGAFPDLELFDIEIKYFVD
jgi:hypothetical protein